MSRPIEDYAMLGDGHTAALVSRDGSIDWLCWPRFDSDACFAALLGTEEHGRWRIGAAEPGAEISRRYRDDTLILETRISTASGEAMVTDYMPIAEDGVSSVVREIRGLRGEVALESRLRLRFDYGSVKPWVRSWGGEVVGVVGPDLVVLRGDREHRASQEEARCDFTLAEGDTVRFTLQHGPSHRDVPAPLDLQRSERDAEAFWRNWAAQFDRPTEWPVQVKRSLLTLKALIHRPTGGMVAAPTLGLPEEPGGGMNWDYRFCWLRDATFTLIALLNAGYRDDAHAWLQWLLRAVAGVPEQMRVMYRVDGARHLEEWEVPWLPGYDGAKPVRVGNAAVEQHQLDIFGEVLDCTFLAESTGIERTPWDVEVEGRLVAHLERTWREPDRGMWESRDPPRHYVHSKVMAWVAVDRFIRSSRGRSDCDAERLQRLETLQAEMHAEICREGFNPSRNSFVQSYGAEELDASLLLLPLVQFLPVEDPRMAGTIAGIERHMMEGGLVRRYEPPFMAGEGTFLACSFWLADCMLLQGRRDEARALFERVLGLCNDVGLLAEGYHVGNGRMTGNFPQALSHLALVNTALALCGPVVQRGG
ncbi:glycoside hydrolase family 15 protein [Roseomonas sp. BN140053]|uniref:glycoside hydrolase family 15 protein n=1 Tax=Roseomonas sp. BN140053 TaxID=3391898 RepID=UPI0039E90EDF